MVDAPFEDKFDKLWKNHFMKAMHLDYGLCQNSERSGKNRERSRELAQDAGMPEQARKGPVGTCKIICQKP